MSPILICSGQAAGGRAQELLRPAEHAEGPTLLRPAPSALRPSQEGYTLAALIVILTIIAIVVSFTVPPQWSLIMRREREKQTIFLMKQFARGILAWEQKHGGTQPPNLEMLQKARNPRFLRGDGKWAMPLTGRPEDWIMVPQTAVMPAGVVPPPGGQPGIGISSNPATSTAPTPAVVPGQGGSKFDPAASPKDYVGPFVAVRPNATGPSLIALNGAEDYSQWIYTVQDLKQEIMNRQTAMSMPK